MLLVALTGDSGGSGSGTTIGSLATQLYIHQTLKGNVCVPTTIQEIYYISLNKSPETAANVCVSNPSPCYAQGTLQYQDQSSPPNVSPQWGIETGPTAPFPYYKGIYGATDNAPPASPTCEVGSSIYHDALGDVHSGGVITYCW